MKNFKRVLAFVLAGVLALAMLTACGSVVEDPTEKIVKEKCTAYMQEALKGTDTIVEEDAKLQQIAAAAVQASWKKNEKDVASAKTKDNETVIITWTEVAFTNRELPALTAAEGEIVKNIKNTDNGYYDKFGVHAKKADVYTAVRNGEVLVAFVFQFPSASN